MSVESGINPYDIRLQEALAARRTYLELGAFADCGVMDSDELAIISHKLNLSPHLGDKTMAGWVKVDQAAAIANRLERTDVASVDIVLVEAQQVLEEALEFEDDPDELIDEKLRIALALAAVPFYRSWILKCDLPKGAMQTFQQQTAEIGWDVLANLKEPGAHDEQTTRRLERIASQLVVMLTHNRRQKDPTTSFAVPSLARQSQSIGAEGFASLRPGGKSADWSINMIRQDQAGWELDGRFFVMPALDMQHIGASRRDYDRLHPDITIVALRQHLYPGVSDMNIVKALTYLTENTLNNSQKNRVKGMTAELYAHLDRDRQRRGAVG